MEAKLIRWLQSKALGAEPAIALVALGIAFSPLLMLSGEAQPAPVQAEIHDPVPDPCASIDLALADGPIIKTVTPHILARRRLDSGEQVTSVSTDLYRGWRAYQTFCHMCHSRTAAGQSDGGEMPLGARRHAPSLAPAVHRGQQFFTCRVRHGYKGMPPWRDNLLVNDRIEDIFLYVAAITNRKLQYHEIRERHLSARSPEPDD